MEAATSWIARIGAARNLLTPSPSIMRGHYLRMSFLAPAEVISELERRIRIEDGSRAVHDRAPRRRRGRSCTRIEEAAVQRARRIEEEKRRAAEAAAAAEREAELQREYEARAEGEFATQRREYTPDGEGVRRRARACRSSPSRCPSRRARRLTMRVISQGRGP